MKTYCRTYYNTSPPGRLWVAEGLSLLRLFTGRGKECRVQGSAPIRSSKAHYVAQGRDQGGLM